MGAVDGLLGRGENPGQDAIPITEPNFFVVGAAKSGTTALYHALSEHPDVYLPAVKEPHFYAYLADPSVGSHLFADEATARRQYRDLYAEVVGQRAVGDASTTNLVVEGAAGAIARDVPAARIVAVLRQPVDRAFSHWCHFRAAGGEEISDFAVAVRREDERKRAGYPFTYQYLGWGRYADQLPPFYELFGRGRVMVHLYDDLLGDPEGVVRSTLRFLGVGDPVAMPPLGRHNETPPIARFPGASRRLRRVRRVIPSQVRRPLVAWASRRLRSHPTLDPALRAELTATFREDISRLEDLIGRDLSAWR